MPPERPRLRTPAKPALDLPPPFRLVSLREVGDSFAHAMRVAPREGAGTLVHVGRFDLAEFAVVLEPEEPLRSARRALYAGLAALADALAVHAPPERALTLDWPDAVRIEGALVGGARLGWPPRASEDRPPDWLVFAAMIRTVAIGEEEPGLRPLSSALDEEGFDTLVSDRLVESFARHFMTAIDTVAQDCELVPVFGGGLLPATRVLVAQEDRIFDWNPSATGLLHKGMFSSGERDNRFRARIDRTRP